MKDILILDDDSAVLSILSGILSTAGYTCHESVSPEAALETLAHEPRITVVLSDYYMPEMNGLEFIQRVISLDRPTPYVLLVTAQPSMQMVVEAMRLGVCDFLTKPATPLEVVGAVERVMRRTVMELQHNHGAPDLGALIRRAQELAAHLQRLASAEKELSWPVSSPVEYAPLLQTMETFRQLRAQCITRAKLDDAAWDMLLDLASAEHRGQRLSVSGLMVSGSHVSATTLLRRVNELVDREFIVRRPDPQDARRHFVDLTPKGHALVSEFLANVGEKLYPRTAQSECLARTPPRSSMRSISADSR